MISGYIRAYPNAYFILRRTEDCPNSIQNAVSQDVTHILLGRDGLGGYHSIIRLQQEVFPNLEIYKRAYDYLLFKEHNLEEMAIFMLMLEMETDDD
jgi:hypothetical protein